MTEWTIVPAWNAGGREASWVRIPLPPGDLLPVLNGEASHEPKPAELGTYGYTPTGCWRGHAAGTPIGQ